MKEMMLSCDACEFHLTDHHLFLLSIILIIIVHIVSNGELTNKMSLYRFQKDNEHALHTHTHNLSFFELNKCVRTTKFKYTHTQTHLVTKQSNERKSSEANDHRDVVFFFLFIPSVHFPLTKNNNINIWCDSWRENKNGNARLHDVKHDLCKNLGTRWNADSDSD